MPFVIASLNVALIAGIAWWLSRKTARQHQTVFWLALLLKCLAGLLLGAVYFYYYGLGDTIGFHSDAVRLVSLLKDNPSLFIGSILSGEPPIDLVNREPRSFFFTLLLTLANFLTGNNYWISSLWFSFFSFACTWFLVVRILSQMPGLYKSAIVAFLFLPSAVFWSAGIIKESVGFGALCILAGIFISLLTGRRLYWYEYLATVVAAWLLIGLKYYWAAVFLPSVITTLVVHWLVAKRLQSTWALTLSWVMIFAACCVVASFTHPNFYIETFLDVIRLSNEEFVAISDPSNLIYFPRVVNGWDDVVVNSPWALFSGLFRPFPFEPHNITGHVSSLENLALLGLTIARLIKIGKSRGSERLLWFSIIAFSVLLCIFLAMSTPNFGTLSRYRIGFLPFFALMIIHDNVLLKKAGLRDF
jgi:hypothetical protein